MLKIEKNKPLATYTTLRLGGKAEYFAVIKTKEDILEAIKFAKAKKLVIYIIGGGSNLLISGNVSGLVLKNEIKGIEIVKKTKTFALIQAMSGELWTRLVHYTIQKGLYGLENTFLIYGTVGASPVQNIGAYGVELKDVFNHLIAIDLKTGQEKKFTLEECKFGYRDSIFKRGLKGKYFIYSVTVKASYIKKFKLDYGSINKIMLSKGIKTPTLKTVSQTIAEVRNSKLPNPYVLPNAGSFFKNPEICSRRFKTLQTKYPDVPFYPSGTRFKLPAAWLIEQAGFKGKKFGSVRMYEKQALILVNEGSNPKQALKLMEKVQAGVKEKFNINLEPEVNII